MLLAAESGEGGRGGGAAGAFEEEALRKGSGILVSRLQVTDMYMVAICIQVGELIFSALSAIRQKQDVVWTYPLILQSTPCIRILASKEDEAGLSLKLQGDC